MMTPEQVQRTIEFILSSQAESAVRMDRIEESQSRFRDDLLLLKENFVRLTQEHERDRVSLREQRENLDVLLSVTHDLVQVSKIHNERIKRVEFKAKKNPESGS